MITSPRLPPCRRTANSVPTSAETAAQPAIAEIRSRAAAMPSPKVASCPWKIASAVAARPTEKKVATRDAV